MQSKGDRMQMGRRFDPLYDPLYKTSDSREAESLEHETFSDKRQQRLPSYKNMFSAIPERYPSYSLRSQSIEAARQEQEKRRGPTRTSSASPTRSVRSMKLRRTPLSPKKPSSSPALGRTASTQTPKRLQQKGRMEKASGDVYPVAYDHAKLKAVFEKALPPLTNSSSLAIRKQLMEAWESAEWESREAQIRALQEGQLKEFEATIKAKHAQTEESISQRLSARWAIEQSTADAAIAKVAHQGMRKAQQLTKVRQRDVAGSKSGRFDDMLGAVGHSMMRVRKDESVQADLGTPPAETGTISRADSSAMLAYRLDAQSGLTGELQPPSRKELAYLGHLDRVHQAILAGKGSAQSAQDLAEAAQHDKAEPDILVVEESSDLEQAEQLEGMPELADTTAPTELPALEPAAAKLAAELAAQLSAGAADQADIDDELAAESAALEPSPDAAELPKAAKAVAGDESAVDEAWLTAAEDTTEQASAELPDAFAAEVAAMTNELLDVAIHEGQAMNPQTSGEGGKEVAIRAVLEATLEPEEGDAVDITIERLVSTIQSVSAGEDDSVLTTTDSITDAEGHNQPQSPDTGNIGSEEVLSDSANMSAAEQQALANRILSGIDAPFSYGSGTMNAYMLHNDINVSPDSIRSTLDSLISSSYQPKESTEMSSAGYIYPQNMDFSAVTNEADGDAMHSPEHSLAQDAAAELDRPESQLAMQVGPSQGPVELSTGTLHGDATEASLASTYSELSANDTKEAASPGAADAEDDAGPDTSLHTASGSEVPLAAEDVNMEAHAKAEHMSAEETLESPGIAAGGADAPEARISINLEPKLEWRVNAEITLQQPAENSPTLAVG